MSQHHDNPLTELPASLRSAVEQILAEPLAADDLRRALAPLHRINDLASVRRAITPRRAVWIAALAASLLVGLWILQPRRSAWAEVVEAVARRPWLHGSAKTSDGQDVEFWYSTSKKIMAGKGGGRFLFSDAQTGTMEIYDAADRQFGAINRLELSPGNRQRFADQGVLYQALLSGDVERAFGGSQRELVEQHRREVTVDGRRSDEYRFVLAATKAARIRTEMMVLVDLQTKLPTRWQVVSRGPDGQEHGRTYELDYPNSGPATIYALGVPPSVPIIDQVPRGNLKRILEGLALGRTRFDNYGGLAVTGSLTPVSDGRGPALCYQVWRKGPKWRIELCQRKTNERMPSAAEPRVWWNEQVTSSRRILKRLGTGTDDYTFDPLWTKPPQPDPEYPLYLKLDSLKKQVRPIDEPADPWPGQIREMPEMVGHPKLLGQDSFGYRLTVDPNPKSGPAGCLLVQSMQTAVTPRRSVGARYWIDPARDYLVMRYEGLGGNPENPQVSQASEITGVAQSPAGRWYPTQVRVIGGSVSLDTGEKSDYFDNYYLDFDAEVPDTLFEIPD
jgi:hypothetical protein